MEIQPLCDVFIVVSFDDRIQVCAKMFFFFFFWGKESSSKPHLKKNKKIYLGKKLMVGAFTKKKAQKRSKK